MSIAKTIKPPYYAVIFTSIHRQELHGYEEMAEKMLASAHKQEGFLGYESAREGTGITISYWENPEAIKKWKLHNEHMLAQEKGRREWYAQYKVRICKVEHDYGFSGQELMSQPFEIE